MRTFELYKSSADLHFRLVCLLLLLTAVLLSGCASAPRLPENSGKKAQSNEVWRVEGRLAVKTQDDNFSATLQWQQSGDDFQFRLSKLIGGTLLLMKQRNGMVYLDVDDKQYKDWDAEVLLKRVTGWTVPIADLKYWIRGTLQSDSDAAIRSQKRDPKGLLWSFETVSGWQVNYKNYKQFSGQSLPHTMTIRGQGLTLRIRVSNWKFGQ